MPQNSEEATNLIWPFLSRKTYIRTIFNNRFRKCSMYNSAGQINKEKKLRKKATVLTSVTRKLKQLTWHQICPNIQMSFISSTAENGKMNTPRNRSAQARFTMKTLVTVLSFLEVATASTTSVLPLSTRNTTVHRKSDDRVSTTMLETISRSWDTLKCYFGPARESIHFRRSPCKPGTDRACQLLRSPF